MDGFTQRNIEEIAADWITALDRAMSAHDGNALSRLFATNSYWRNICGITWSFATVGGIEDIIDALLARGSDANVRNFELFAERHPPRLNIVGGEDVIEAVFRFETDIGIGIGVVRFKPEDPENPSYKFVKS